MKFPKHEVTNVQFLQFADATGYVTASEKKADDSVLTPALLTFFASNHPVNLNNNAMCLGMM